MRKTHLELATFINLATAYKQRHPELSGFSRLLSKLEKNIKKAIKEKGHEEVYSDGTEDARYDLCKKYESGDKKGCLLLNDQGGFMFTPENHKKLVKEIKKLTEILNATEIEIDFGVEIKIEGEPSEESVIAYNLTLNGEGKNEITAEQALILSSISGDKIMEEIEFQNNGQQ